MNARREGILTRKAETNIIHLFWTHYLNVRTTSWRRWWWELDTGSQTTKSWCLPMLSRARIVSLFPSESQGPTKVSMDPTKKIQEGWPLSLLVLWFLLESICILKQNTNITIRRSSLMPPYLLWVQDTVAPVAQWVLKVGREWPTYRFWETGHPEIECHSDGTSEWSVRDFTQTKKVGLQHRRIWFRRSWWDWGICIF